MGQDFSSTSRGRAGLGLDFLDPLRPTLPHPRPRPRPHPAPPHVAKSYNCKKFSYPKTLLFKQAYQY